MMIPSLSFKAMSFAEIIHKDQKRKYTNEPYFKHLAEVVGIAMSVGWQHVEVTPDVFMATAWLHDSIEDQEVSFHELLTRFGINVANGVMALSDFEVGNRATRKKLSCERLAEAPGWIQTIKCADLISNTSSIVQHDPKFAKVYLKEKIDLLDSMHKADPRLSAMARQMAKDGLSDLGLIA